jgi:hypothetical protein
MLDDENYFDLTHGEAACAIYNLTEILPPCPCDEKAVIIAGETVNGSIVRIVIDERIRIYGATAADIRDLQRRCLEKDRWRDV